MPTPTDPPPAPPGATAGASVDVHDPRVVACIGRYWRANVKIMAGLLLVWAVVGLGCGVLFADVLNRFQLGGIPLGFWFAQQGSILVFVVLILVYAVWMSRLDTRHRRELDAIRASGDPRPEPPARS